MAILLDRTLGTGVVVKYWRVTGVHIDFLSRTCSATYVGYLNKQARATGKAPVVSGNMDVPFLEDFTSATDFVKAAYAVLKNEELKGGEDDVAAVSG